LVSKLTPGERVAKAVWRAPRRHSLVDHKIRIVLGGLRSEDSIAEICRKEAIAQSLYYFWSKVFLEAGRRRLARDRARSARSDAVKAARREATALKSENCLRKPKL
jgi:transposase